MKRFHSATQGRRESSSDYPAATTKSSNSNDSQAWRSRRGCRPTFRCWCLEVLALAMGAMVVATLWARQKPASHVRLPFVLPLYAGVFNASWQTHAPLKVSSTLDRHSPRRSLMTKSEAPKFISESVPNQSGGARKGIPHGSGHWKLRIVVAL